MLDVESLVCWLLDNPGNLVGMVALMGVVVAPFFIAINRLFGWKL